SSIYALSLHDALPIFDVNFVQQKVNDLKLVDSISENQDFLEDSIKVYYANIDENGNASKGGEVFSDEYTLDINQDAGEFTVKWRSEEHTSELQSRFDL